MSKAKQSDFAQTFSIGVLGRISWENMGKRSSYITENMELETST